MMMIDSKCAELEEKRLENLEMSMTFLAERMSTMVDQIKAKAQVENIESQDEVRGQEEIEQDSEDNFKEEDYTYVLDA